jgi:alkylation response protein AidB-like acyl-CoA dehydrogenase
MELSLTQEQQGIRDAVKRLADRFIQPALDSHDRNSPLPKPVFLEILGKLAALGLPAARLPESAGGPGISMLDYGIAFEPLPASTAVSLVAQEVTIARLYAECTDAQRARLLPDLVAGRKIACTGSTEPDAGSDPRGIRARLTRRDGKLLLNGRKMWITNVSACDTILATCLDAREGGGNRVIKVVVERDRSPFEAKEIATIGLRQGMLGECVFEDCEISPENVVEAPRGGTAVLKASWSINRPLFGLIAVGLAQRAYDIALEYAKTRRQFGKPIGAHQLIQKNLSDIATAIVASRLMCYHALSLADEGRETAGAAAMAKRFAQTECQNAVFQAMNVLGAMGLSEEARVEQIYRDIRMIPVPDGTNEILALIHGRELTGMEAFRGGVPRD